MGNENNKLDIINTNEIMNLLTKIKVIEDVLINKDIITQNELNKMFKDKRGEIREDFIKEMKTEGIE